MTPYIFPFPLRTLPIELRHDSKQFDKHCELIFILEMNETTFLYSLPESCHESNCFEHEIFRWEIELPDFRGWML